MMRKVNVAAVAAILTASSMLLSGCGDVRAGAAGTAEVSPSVPAGKSRPAWTPAPAGPQEVVYAEGSIRSSPPPAGASAVLTAALAIATAVGDSGGLITKPDQATAALRLVSDDRPPGEGPGDPPLHNTLAWIVTAHGDVPRSGPPGRAAPPSPSDCTIWSVILADTAVSVRNFYSCGT